MLYQNKDTNDKSKTTKIVDASSNVRNNCNPVPMPAPKFVAWDFIHVCCLFIC